MHVKLSSGFCRGSSFLFLLGKTEPVGDDTNRNSHQDIHHRMLLEENGGNADQESADAKEPLPAGSLESFDVPGCTPDRHRADYVDGRTDVGGSVKCIQTGHQTGQNIVSLKDQRTKFLTGREHQIDTDGDGVGNDDELHKATESINIIKQGIYMHANEEKEPEPVGQQKQLIERDQVIQSSVHREVIVDGG